MRVYAAVLAGLVVLSGCTQPRESPSTPSDPATASAQGIPAEEPAIRGAITRVEPNGRILIEEKPADQTGSEKAHVTPTEGARILHRSGAAASRADLAVGMLVSAWFTGPVRESYPVQADAHVLVIEPGNP